MTQPVSKPTGRALTAQGIPLPVVQLDWGNAFSKAQLITVTSPASQSSVFNAGSDVVIEVCSSADCWYTVTGSSSVNAQVGVANNQFLGAGVSRYVYVPANSFIGVIQNASSGALSAIPILLSS